MPLYGLASHDDQPTGAHSLDGRVHGQPVRVCGGALAPVPSAAVQISSCCHLLTLAMSRPPPGGLPESHYVHKVAAG